MNDWQPIATAPKNTIIDLWCEGAPSDIHFYCGSKYEHAGRVVNCKFYANEWRPVAGLTLMYPLPLTPTHWMPLPEPPNE